MGILSDILGTPEPRATLSEYQSKLLLAEYGIPVTREILTSSVSEALAAAGDIGFPVVLKGSSAELAHKSEANVIRLDLRGEDELVEAYGQIETAAPHALDGILVQEMVRGERQLAVGLIRDNQFGPCVMFGLGGIYAEILSDAAFRIAPLSRRDALTLLNDIRGAAILGPARGAAPADRDALAEILIALGSLGQENDIVSALDVNPLMLRDDGRPVAVDAAVWLTAP